ncbi:MAG TPA: SusC/RagA family TonB-linked outer membrane protein, partial [Chitinophaga sp.]|nr:SusC/RagA family TonB-linked outer membrane protein [Chitinophaga sp.]
VKEKGTTNGTMTNAEGGFRLSVNANGTLVISYMGYLTREVPASGDLNISLAEDNKNLNEVVVTALGMKREQRKLGYAITELKGDQITKTNSINPVAALQGKVAGVDISGASGGPQAANRIVLRGAKSLNDKDQPIFVVDGVIFENTTSDNAVNFGNVLKNLNPDDYESVTVLKGAAATALYGSRALNGAVLITTKKGTVRKGIGVTVSQTVQLEQVYKTPIELQNSYGAGRDGIIGTTANPDLIDWAGGYSFGPKMQGQMAELPNGDVQPYSAKPDNYKDMYRTGQYYNTNVAMEGGSEKGTFRASFSHLNNLGIVPNNEFKRNNFSIKATQAISKYLSVDGGVTYSQSTTDNPDRQGGDYSNYNLGRKYVYVFPRNYDPAYWSRPDNFQNPDDKSLRPTGQYAGADYWFTLKYNTWTRKESLTTGYLNLNATATDWLKFVLKGNFSKENVYEERKEAGQGPNYSGGAGYYSEYGMDRLQHTFTGIAMITPKLGKDLEGSLNLGAETWNSGIGNQFLNRTNGGLRLPGLYSISNSAGIAQIDNQPLDRKRINSVFFAASLAYKNAFFLDVTGRNDWSTALTYLTGNSNNSYFYPSFSGAWEFTESLKGKLPQVISFGKLRASYAMVGGDLSPYQTSSGYRTQNFFTGANTNGNLPRLEIYNGDILLNPDLKPSISRSLEFGGDIRFFNNRLGFDVAWYKTNIKNQIIQLPTTIESGVEKRYINAGNMQNTGIEFAINGTPIQKKNFTWDVTLNGSHNKNKIISLTPEVSEIQLNEDQFVRVIAVAGKAYGQLATTRAYTRNAQGQKVFNKDASFGVAYVQRDNNNIGNITPDLNLGLSNNFTYKNWNLSFLVQARIGGDMFSASHQYGTGRGTTANTLAGRDAASGGITWTDATGRTRDDGMIPDGVFANGYKVVANGTEVDLSGQTYKQAYDAGYVTPLTPYQYYGMLGDWGAGIREYSVFDASYVSLREVSIGYSLPASILERVKLNSVRVNLIGRNLGLLYNNMPNGVNPEALRNNSTSAFSEYGGTPYTRNMAVTVQVGF